MNASDQNQVFAAAVVASVAAVEAGVGSTPACCIRTHPQLVRSGCGMTARYRGDHSLQGEMYIHHSSNLVPVGNLRMAGRDERSTTIVEKDADDRREAVRVTL